MYGPHLSDYDINRIYCVKSHHTEAFDSSDFLFASCEDPHTHSKCNQYTQINDVFRNDADGTDGGSDTQYHQDVKYVGTDGVTQCHIDFIFSGCNARKFLNDRKEKIRGELEEAKDNQEKAAELKAQYEAKLKDIDKEAEDILSDARRRALQNEERIVTQAKEEAARILARAQEEARLEKQKMSDEIKQEIVSVASVMAGKLVGASIDTTRQNSLIEETLKEMGEDTWQN